MSDDPDCEFLQSRYRQVHGCSILPSFRSYLKVARSGALDALVGYRRALAEPLFLERYPDAPVDQVLSVALGRPFARNAVGKIGNLAADDPTALVQLWARATNGALKGRL